MSSTLASLPLPLRAINFSLDKFSRRLVDLSAENLLSKASKKTGLDDYGSEYFRGPLARLLQSLEQDAHLTVFGRLMARQEILRLMGNRLQLVDIFKRHPEIAEQEIIAPVFILGMPRTGTTSLHELMALDPQFRVPLTWEVAHPFPPPEKASYATDTRIEKVTKELSGVDKLLPGFKDMHPMGAQLPQECVALFSHDFASMIFDVQFRLTQYQDWIIKEDMAEVFKQHRRWLQLLQWKCPGDTWVLKSPQYLWNIKDMLREYPDARIIQNHRDPVKVAMSIGSLTTTLRSLGSNCLDVKEATQSYADQLYYGTQTTMAARDEGLISADRAFDIQFAEFRKDPVQMVDRAYQHLGLELSEPVAQKMQAFLDQGKETERHGKHSYNLANSGLDLEKERERFAEYQRVYQVPTENID
jgi:hypothetical protein